ncbi:MAG: sulfatase [Chrysiogenales bacterium]
MKKIRTFPVVLILTVLVVAAIAAVIFFTRTPGYFHGQRHCLSPVLKPQDVGERSFFFSQPNYLLRLDAEQPSLIWTLDRSVRGLLAVSFFAFPQGEAALTFSVTQYGRDGRPRKVINEVVRQKEAQLFQRQYKVGVALPVGGKLIFAVRPAAETKWPSFNIGITVPRIEMTQKTPRPANLLIVSIDALRSDTLGVYQALDGKPPKYSASPELDRFAKEAVVFLNARTTQSATWPALASLHLSQYPHTHGVFENRQYLKGGDDSIALALLKLGYNTRSFMSNAFAFNIPGFEEKWDFLDDEHLIDFVRNKIFETANVPYFDWCHLWGVHATYNPPLWAMEALKGRKLSPNFKLQYDTNEMMLGQKPCGPADVKAVRDLYAGALYYTDFLIKKLFADIKARGLWDDTMIIVTADHGEELHDHNRYFYHNPSLYDSAIHVPLLIKFPHQHRQHLVEENVSLLDIFPTVYHYFIAPPPPNRFSSLSLLDLLAGADKPFRERILFAEPEGSKIAVAISGRKKLSFNPLGLVPLGQFGRPFPIAKVEFFDLETDPGERNNLAAARDPVRSWLLGAVERFPREGPPIQKGKLGKFEISDKMKKEAEEKLRNLGYIR